MRKSIDSMIKEYTILAKIMGKKADIQEIIKRSEVSLLPLEYFLEKERQRLLDTETPKKTLQEVMLELRPKKTLEEIIQELKK